METKIIKATNLTREFMIGDRAQRVLDDVNIEVNQGDFCVVMGRSGSGKSTLLYALSYMDRPSSGEVVLDGKTCDYNPKTLEKIFAEKISFVFQSGNLISDLTAFENVAFPGYLIDKKEHINEKTKALLAKLGLEAIENHHPHEMSGGEIQRVAIARALLKNPQVLFADEPTGALNSKYGCQILDLFNEANSDGQTIVMVTHDVKAATRGNRVLYISDGKIKSELDLGKYKPDEQAKREEKTLAFLKEMDW